MFSPKAEWNAKIEPKRSLYLGRLDLSLVFNPILENGVKLQ